MKEKPLNTAISQQISSAGTHVRYVWYLSIYYVQGHAQNLKARPTLEILILRPKWNSYQLFPHTYINQLITLLFPTHQLDPLDSTCPLFSFCHLHWYTQSLSEDILKKIMLHCYNLSYSCWVEVLFSNIQILLSLRWIYQRWACIK